jgi:very-long-chain ceramide synthase
MDVSLISYLHAASTAHALFRYFRHYLNFVMMYSVYKDFNLIPCVLLFYIHIFTRLTAVDRQSARSFSPSKGVWMVWWMKWQIFTPLLLLQFLNLFWYVLIWRVLWRYVVLSFVSYTSI